MNSISTALVGLQAANTRLDQAAQNIVHSSASSLQTPATPQSIAPVGTQVSLSASSPSTNDPPASVDITPQMLALIMAQQSAAANVTVIQTQDTMTRSLLDIRA